MPETMIFDPLHLTEAERFLEQAGTIVLKRRLGRGDFPTASSKDHPRVIALPHLGASTGEAEENCAVMVADTLRDFLEHGNVRNSVNFPEAELPRVGNRVAIDNDNVPNMSARFRPASPTRS